MQQIADWLKKLGMSEYGERFAEIDIDIDVGFDRATVAIDSRDPENPAAVRSLVADRIRRGWGFKRLTREKIWSAETHLGDGRNRGHVLVC